MLYFPSTDEETEIQRSKLGTLVLYFEFKVVGTHGIGTYLSVALFKILRSGTKLFS